MLSSEAVIRSSFVILDIEQIERYLSEGARLDAASDAENVQLKIFDDVEIVLAPTMLHRKVGHFRACDFTTNSNCTNSGYATISSNLWNEYEVIINFPGKFLGGIYPSRDRSVPYSIAIEFDPTKMPDFD